MCASSARGQAESSSLRGVAHPRYAPGRDEHQLVRRVGGGGDACCAVSHRGRCSYTEHIGEARTHRRSTRPGCECQPAAAELPAYPVRTEGGAPTHNISEKPEPTVGAPAPGVNASRRRRSCRQTRFAPGAVLLHETYRRSPSPL